MIKRIASALLVAALAVFALGWPSGPAHAQPAAGVQWIWHDEGDPLKEAPAETRYFRRTFDVGRAVEEAQLDVTADRSFRVWLNGVEVGSGDDPKTVRRFDVARHFVKGKNVLAVEARGGGGPAGLLVKLTYNGIGLPKTVLTSDKDWKSSKSGPEGWERPGFDDAKWQKARVLGEYGKVGVWKDLAWAGEGKTVGAERFTVPAGFKVELAVQPPSNDKTFSLVNMTFDNKGRLLVSRENGPVLLCTDPDEKGVCKTVKPYCEVVKNCQGMCWDGDSLLLVGNGPGGTGLFRCTSSSKDSDKLDQAKLLHKFQGGMQEHGPHAILHGPDGWLYLVSGNHAHAAPGLMGNPGSLAANSPLTRWPNGQMGPDQGKPGSTEDVLLPRQNDANGHAANILAPGGTIWRLDHDGKNMSLVTAGFRNHFDAAFAPNGELFTFDSDMEWDIGLPWYRAVRICHCPPGADFVWRTGAANTPNYYIDSLPPLYETGRGSPVGVEFYDHYAFGPEYRGCYFMADWSIGVIWSVFLERDGATYKAKKVEKFCQGAPMNVTDLAVGKDGALYFTMGGRNTQGGVYRIVRTDNPARPKQPDKDNTKARRRATVAAAEQPLSAWGREQFKEAVKGRADTALNELIEVAEDAEAPTPLRLRALTLVQTDFEPKQVEDAVFFEKCLVRLCRDRDAEVRAHAVWLLGVRGYPRGKEPLLAALKDGDALVRRRACEALIRAGFEPKVEDVWPLLGDKDKFVRTAARLVLQRLDSSKWVDRIAIEKDDLTAWEATIALCKTDRPFKDAGVLARLDREPPADPAALLDWLRTVQMVALHGDYEAKQFAALAARCDKLFPQQDYRVNRELAILLTHFGNAGVIPPPQAKLLAALESARSRNDVPQQIHYFYCLRLLKDGWTPEQKAAVLTWFEGTRTWSGGNSFTPFLANILRDFSRTLSADDVKAAFRQGDKQPYALAVLLRVADEQRTPPAAELADLYKRVQKDAGPAAAELRRGIVAGLGKKNTPEAQAALRAIADADTTQRDNVARSLLSAPTADNFPYLVAGLNSPDKLLLADLIRALKKCPAKPKPEDGASYRALLLASRRLDEKQRWEAVLLLRQWSNGRQFGADEGDWKTELTAWGRWYGQAFPKEPPLPDAGAVTSTSKYKFDELLAYLTDGEGKKGDAVKGRLVFEKAQCVKCHKYGAAGEGVGPDLSEISKRFKRFDTLEAIIYPSKAISDQYRSTQIVTKQGRTYLGLASAPQDGVITILLQDGSKATVKVSEIDQKFDSLISVMPEQLLDALTKEEIADLFAFLESDPAAVTGAGAGPGK
jgi:putative heme-binding domain-containing protein